MQLVLAALVTGWYFEAVKSLYIPVDIRAEGPLRAATRSVSTCHSGYQPARAGPSETSNVARFSSSLIFDLQGDFSLSMYPQH